MAGRLLKMEDINQSYGRVANLSHRDAEISNEMNEAYSERSDALDEVCARWNNFDEAKKNLQKAKKQFRKGEIDEDEYQCYIDRFEYFKRSSKRASKQYKSLNNRIRELRREKQGIRKCLMNRI